MDKLKKANSAENNVGIQREQLSELILDVGPANVEQAAINGMLKAQTEQLGHTIKQTRRFIIKNISIN
jgi:hypothetical protein